MIYKHQQTHDPPYRTLLGLLKPSTFPHLVMSYIEAGQIAEKDNLTQPIQNYPKPTEKSSYHLENKQIHQDCHCSEPRQARCTAQ